MYGVGYLCLIQPVLQLQYINLANPSVIITTAANFYNSYPVSYQIKRNNLESYCIFIIKFIYSLVSLSANLWASRCLAGWKGGDVPGENLNRQILFRHAKNNI